MRGTFCRALLALAALLMTTMPVAAQVSVVPIDQLQPIDYLPVVVGLLVMLVLWRVLVLGGLLVGEQRLVGVVVVEVVLTDHHVSIGGVPALWVVSDELGKLRLCGLQHRGH